MKEENGITRKEFLKKVACISLCPFILNSMVSCGKKDKLDDITGKRIEAASFTGMAIGSSQLLDMEGTKYGIILHRKSNEEYFAFDARCPHKGFKVVPEEGSEYLGTCVAHGGTFKLSEEGGPKGTGINPPVMNKQLKFYPVSFKGDHLLIKLS